MRKWAVFLVASGFWATSPACGGSSDTPCATRRSDSGAEGGTCSSSGGSGGSSGSSSGASANVSILVYPDGHHTAGLIAAINAAQTSVYMTIYEIDDAGVIGAITSAKSRGLDVEVILDGSTTTRSNNRNAYNAFSGYVTWSSSRFTYTHEKCVMIDHKQAWIMTANAESSVPERNREYLAIDDNPADVTEAEEVFQADYANHSYSPSGALVLANSNARADLVSLIGSAQKSLDIEDEEFSDSGSGGVTNAVVAAAGRGVTVRLVVAGGGTSSTQTAALASVKDAPGASVYVSTVSSGGGTSSNPYIHAKAILVDCATGTCKSGFVGSRVRAAHPIKFAIFPDPSIEELARNCAKSQRSDSANGESFANSTGAAHAYETLLFPA